MSARRLVVLAVCLAIAMAIGQIVAGGKLPGKPDEPQSKGVAEPGKGKRAQAFIAAFNKGDAKETASFWAPDATYVDQVGREIKGRAAIEKLYEKVFAGNKGAKLTVHVTSARLLTPEVAVEDGTTEVTPADGNPGTVARFSAVLVRKDGEWYFESVHESVARPPTHAGHFEDIDWLIGEWTGESDCAPAPRARRSYADLRRNAVDLLGRRRQANPVLFVLLGRRHRAGGLDKG